MESTDAKQQLNVTVDFSKFPELWEGMEQVVKQEDSDKSKYIRRLVRQDVERRMQLPLPAGKKKRTGMPA